MPLLLPNDPAPGKPIRADWGKRLLQFIRSLRPGNSDSIRINWTANGWTAHVRTKGGKGGGNEIEPHQVTSVTSNKIEINNGTVNNLLATPIGGLTWTAPTDPDALNYVVCRATMTAESGPSAVQYVELTEPPGGFAWSKNELPTELDILIAVLKGTTAIQIRTGNLTATPVKKMEVPKDTVTVGEYPYDIYWAWEVD